MAGSFSRSCSPRWAWVNPLTWRGDSEAAPVGVGERGGEREEDAVGRSDSEAGDADAGGGARWAFSGARSDESKWVEGCSWAAWVAAAAAAAAAAARRVGISLGD